MSVRRDPVSHSRIHAGFPSRAGLRSCVLRVVALVVAVALAGCTAAGGSASPGSGALRTSPAPAAGDQGVTGRQEPTQVQPGALPGVVGVPETGTSAAGSGSASSGIAYPYPGWTGSGAVAPEKTIVAGGSGHASAKVDGSDRAAAQARATAAAVADAKTQAQAVATALGVSITGVYSVSVAVTSQDVYPPVPACPIRAVVPTPTIGPGGPEPAPICDKPATPAPTSTEVWVSVTVAYSFA